MYPSGPLIVTTLAPNCLAFKTAPKATLPNPEIAIVFPLISSPCACKTSLAKYIVPNPVASGLTKDPPQLSPFPVRTPSCC